MLALQPKILWWHAMWYWWWGQDDLMKISFISTTFRFWLSKSSQVRISWAYECLVDFEKEIMADKGKPRPSDAGKCWSSYHKMQSYVQDHICCCISNNQYQTNFNVLMCGSGKRKEGSKIEVTLLLLLLFFKFAIRFTWYAHVMNFDKSTQ